MSHLISLKRTWEHSSHSLWLDSGTSSGCSQMSRFLQQDGLIRFNPVILVIRFSCLIPSSLQVQCLVRDTTTRGILVKGVDRRTEEGGSSLAVHVVVMIFDPASEDDSILESFGASIISSSTKITQGVFWEVLQISASVPTRWYCTFNQMSNQIVEQPLMFPTPGL